jgi:hypothetical protein
MEKRLARHDAKRQAARIDACPALAPQTDEGRNEVTECLMRNCQDAEHARLVVTRLLDDVLECQNLTAEIAIIAQATRKQDPLPPGCNRCKGEPFIGGPDGLWTRCTCARGQALRARDRSLDDPRGQPNRRRPVLSGTGVRQHLRNPKIEAESAGRSQTTPAPCVWLKLWRGAPDNDWRSKVDDICELLDDAQIPCPKTWCKKDRNCRRWADCLDRPLIIKAIEYRLEIAKQRGQLAPGTFS